VSSEVEANWTMAPTVGADLEVKVYRFCKEMNGGFAAAACLLRR